MIYRARTRIKFALLSRVYDPLVRHLPGQPYLRLSEAAAAVPFTRALDLCTGTGMVAARLAEVRPQARVVGLDASPAMLAMARRRKKRLRLENLDLRQGDVADLPFPDDDFDLVTLSFALHELPTELRERAVGEARRVLAPGGRLLAVEIDGASGAAALAVRAYLAVGEPAHAREVRGKGAAALLGRHGFSVERRPFAGGLFQLLESAA